MRKLFLLPMLILYIIVPVQAAQILPPEPPRSAMERMPDSEVFDRGLWDLLHNALRESNPTIHEALEVGVRVTAVMLLMGILESFTGDAHGVSDIIGVMALAMSMFTNTNAMIGLGMDTVTQINDYGKLLLPVMATALAAQGGVSASAALYAGTTIFNGLLNGFLTQIMCPLIYLYMGLSLGYALTGASVIKHMRDLMKTFSSWCLKMILTVFTTYMSITGVISGTTDIAALKATKVAISSVVPVVGSILSEASESVLISAGLAKNAAGIYGIFAVVAIFLVPFLRIGIHYLVLKGTFAVSTAIGPSRLSEFVADYSAAMGLLLAMTGSACLLQLISTVCFLKGVG